MQSAARAPAAEPPPYARSNAPIPPIRCLVDRMRVKRVSSPPTPSLVSRSRSGSSARKGARYARDRSLANYLDLAIEYIIKSGRVACGSRERRSIAKTAGRDDPGKNRRFRPRGYASFIYYPGAEVRSAVFSKTERLERSDESRYDGVLSGRNVYKYKYIYTRIWPCLG